MKKKYLAITLGIFLSMAAGLTACSTSSGTSKSAASNVSAASSSVETGNANSTYAGQTIYGQIQSIDGTSLTLQIGTQQDGSSDLDLSDETADITLDEDATVTRSGMGGGQQPPSSGDNSVNSSSSGDSSDDSAPQGEPPAMPDGSSGDSSDSSDSETRSTPPAKPDSSSDSGSDDSSSVNSDSSQDSGSDSESAPGNGNAPDSGTAPGNGEAPGQEDLDISSLQEGDNISITFDDDGTVTSIEILGGNGAPGGDMGGGETSAEDISYTAVQDITSDTTLSDQTVDSTGTDENAVLTENGATSTLSGLTINRTSDDSTGGNNASFYGVGASVLTTDGTTYLKNSTITSDADGGAGVFSYGDGVTYVSDTTISTEKGSTLTGAVTDDETNAGEGGDGSCSMYIDSSSTWIVTGDSTVTNLYNAGTITDADGNTVTIKGTDGTVYVEGTGNVTVTVSSYSADVDLSGASSADSWSSYEVAKPEQMA